jgi:hypothetical protein
MRTPWIVGLTLTLAAGIAGCGSSSPPAGGEASPGVALAACMREHGVPNFPDPSASGAGGGPGGGVAVLPAGVDTSAPAFKKASASCGGLLPTPGARHPADAQTAEATLKFSRCMRAHGVTRFPDPSASPPASLSGDGAVIRRGVYLAIPDTINMASPTYRRAAAACRFGPRFS